MKTKVLIIAEIGINFNGDLDTAKSLIELAKICGADIAKFQLYDVNRLFPDKQITTQDKNWYEMVKRTELTFEQIEILFDYCNQNQIEAMASAFDLERLEWLERLSVKRHTVATKMNNNKEYIGAVIHTGKQVLYSRGNKDTGINWIFGEDRKNCLRMDNIQFLYCVPIYPTMPNQLDLPPLFGLGSLFSGFSDHTIGIEASLIAVARGAQIIEKHFTLNSKSQLGPDHICSLEPPEFATMVNYIRKFERILMERWNNE